MYYIVLYFTILYYTTLYCAMTKFAKKSFLQYLQWPSFTLALDCRGENQFETKERRKGEGKEGVGREGRGKGIRRTVLK